MSRSVMIAGLAALLAVLPATGVLAAGAGEQSLVKVPVISVPQGSAPSGSSKTVTIPVLPSPTTQPPSSPAGGGTVTIPVIRGPEETATPPAVQKTPAPIQVMGSNLVLLFGKLEQSGGRYYIVGHRASGEVRYEVTGDPITLAGLTGKQVGVTASKVVVDGTTVRYQIQSALVLTEDLGLRLLSNGGLIYIAPPGQITVQLRGRLVQMDQAPIIGNGRTLVPARAIAEALGAKVFWDYPTRTVYITLGDREVAVTIGSNVAVVRQGTETHEVEIDVAPVLVNNRTLVPARLIAESLGLHVNWDESFRTVEIQ